MIPENGKAKFMKLYPRSFTEEKDPQFQNSQEFALDGGVKFDILANSINSYANGVFISTS